jgi:hypothetical protein
MAITLRAVTGSALSHAQVDRNFSSMYYSSSLTGQVLTFFTTGSATIGQVPTSASFIIPSASKWTDIPGGGIARNSNVEITGSLSQGVESTATGESSHAEGNASQAIGDFSHAEGDSTASGSYSHAEGTGTAIGDYSHAEGDSTQATGDSSHAEGVTTQAIGQASHAEGISTTATGNYSHAEGIGTTSSGSYSHAEGTGTTSSGPNSHAEGDNAQAIGTGSHAEGFNTVASGTTAHAEGNNTIASGSRSHAEGLYTIALGAHQHVQGRYNQTSSADSAFIIGNGINSVNRSNLVFASGSTFQVTGSIYTTGDIVSLGNVTAQQYIVSTSVYYVTESYLSGSHIFGNTLDDTHQFTGSLLVSNSLVVRGTHTVTGSVNINGGMNFTATSTLSTPDVVVNNSTDNLTIRGNQGLILSEANGNVGQIVIGNATNNVAIGNDTKDFVKFARNWNAVSGSTNLTMNALHVSNSINFVSSSGTNIARGLYINPTLTGVPDYRAIETTTGSVVLNGPTTITDILTITPRATTPGSPANGMVIVSGSGVDQHMYCYLNSTWKQLD